MIAVVTGGGGFLGRHLVRRLLDRGDTVRVVGRRRYPEVEAWGAEGFVCDIGEGGDALDKAFSGADVVFHAAAQPPHWVPRDVFWRTNVDGTRNVIASCLRASVPRLVYTSSPSCTFDGTDAEGATSKDCPYPDAFETPYAETKAAAERLVLAANSGRLATTSLRPHLIYGPEEPHMLPRILQRHRSGRLVIIGDGANRVGLTYIDNAVAAHVQAADGLSAGSANAGRAYFVTDPEPVALWTWLNEFVIGVGEAPIRRRVSLRSARTIGRFCELLWSWLPLPGEPPMTPFIASQLATSHWYDLGEGRDDFGLEAVVDADEGLARTIGWFRKQAA